MSRVTLKIWTRRRAAAVEARAGRRLAAAAVPAAEVAERGVGRVAAERREGAHEREREACRVEHPSLQFTRGEGPNIAKRLVSRFFTTFRKDENFI